MGRETHIDWASKSPRLERMLKDGFSQREIATALGVSVGSVQRQIEVLKLPTEKREKRIESQRRNLVKAPVFQPIRGNRPVLQNLAVADLRIDPTYQRKTDNRQSERLIGNIAQKWDWALCLPLVVSNRGGAGELFVIDGQHRLEAAKLRSDIVDLPCVVVIYPDARAEAASFVALNQLRRPLNSLELFHAAVAGGDEEAAAIKAAVEAAGLSIAAHTNNKRWNPGQIGNVAGLRSAWRRYGRGVTGRALLVLAKAYEGHRIQYAGTVFPGIVEACAKRGAPVVDQLAALLGDAGQDQTYRQIMRMRGDDPAISTEQASIEVIDRMLRKARGESDPVAPRPVDLGQFKEGRAWCDQCEMRVTIAQAGGCKSRFCPLKQAERQAV